VREARQSETELSERQRDSEGKEIAKGKETAQGTQNDVKVQQRAKITQALCYECLLSPVDTWFSFSFVCHYRDLFWRLSIPGCRVSLWHKASFRRFAHHIRWTQHLTRFSCAFDLLTILSYQVAMAGVEELTREQIDALLDKAVDQFDHELYAEAAATTRAVLEHGLSRWQKIYAIALLADCLDDWYDAEVSSTQFHQPNMQLLNPY